MAVPFCQEGVIATKQACEYQDIQFVLAQRFGLLDLGFHVQQQVFHLVRPVLLEFFFEEGQFTQVMHVA